MAVGSGVSVAGEVAVSVGMSVAISVAGGVVVGPVMVVGDRVDVETGISDSTVLQLLIRVTRIKAMDAVLRWLDISSSLSSVIGYEPGGIQPQRASYLCQSIKFL